MPAPLVTVKTCSGPAEAMFLKGFLEGYGIPAWDSSERMPSWLGRYSLLSRGVRLRVRQQDAAKAKKLLENPPEYVYKEEDYQQDGMMSPAVPFDPSITPEMCPLCGSANIVEWKSPWIVQALRNLFLLPSYSTWICRDCDWDSKRRPDAEH